MLPLSLYNDTLFQDPTLNGINIAPTSKVGIMAGRQLNDSSSMIFMPY